MDICMHLWCNPHIKFGDPDVIYNGGKRTRHRGELHAGETGSALTTVLAGQAREQCVRQLLSHEEMGDRKPSQFLRHLKGLAPDVPDDFLCTIWTSRLPPHVQVILAGQTEGSLDATAHLADKICEVTPSPNAASIAAPNPDNTSELQERIGELERQLASLRTTRSHSRSHSRHCSKTPAASPNRRQLCWYHRKFNDKAQKCTPPCAKHLENLDSGR